MKWPYKNIPSVFECAKLCHENQNCDGFHYYGYSDSHESKAAGHCYLKSDVTKVSTNLTDQRDRYGGICRKGIIVLENSPQVEINIFPNTFRKWIILINTVFR